MAEDLKQLAFHSQAEDAKQAVNGLIQILSSAQRHNGDSELTGALALSGNRYFQVLEGEAEVIDRTMDRILRDPRHGNVNVVARRPIEQRCFGVWSLASPSMLPSLKLQIDLAISACEIDCDYAIRLLMGVCSAKDVNGRLLAA